MSMAVALGDGDSCPEFSLCALIKNSLLHRSNGNFDTERISMRCVHTNFFDIYVILV